MLFCLCSTRRERKTLVYSNILLTATLQNVCAFISQSNSNISAINGSFGQLSKKEESYQKDCELFELVTGVHKASPKIWRNKWTANENDDVYSILI